MKRALAILAVSILSTPALAHPGGHTLTCKSEGGAKQVIELSLSRSNGKGWYAPSFTITVDGTAHAFTTDDPDLSFGSTLHDSPRGVVKVTADNTEDTTAAEHGGFTVTAIKRTVKAYDHWGHRVRYHAGDADDGCYDSNGKAKFRAVFRGWIDRTRLARQVLSCTLEYDSGMSC